MSMYRCPTCGELFSTSYKKCPFCEEDDLMTNRTAKRSKKKSGSRSKNEPRAIGPALVIVLLLSAALLVFLFKGGDMLASIRTAKSDTPQTGDVTENETATGGEEAAALTLSSATLTVDCGASAALSAAGGSGEYTWTSDHEEIAAVAEDGTVTGRTAGTATVTVSDGTDSVSCTVTVNAQAVELTISKTDVSIRKGESFNIGASGGTITYRSDNEAVAVVGADGVVTGKGYGKANIYASNGSMELSCIVRVK